MDGKKCRVRVDVCFSVPVRKLKKNGRWKEKNKEYLAGEWLRGYFVVIDGRCMFRTGKFLLSPSHFDRVKFPKGESKRMSGKEQEEFLKSYSSPDIYDPHEIFVSIRG